MKTNEVTNLEKVLRILLEVISDATILAVLITYCSL